MIAPRHKIQEQDLAHIAHLSGLVCLDLESTSVGDEALTYLGGLTRIEALDLGSTQIEGVGLRHLRHLRRPRELILTGTQLTDSGLAHLPHLPSLRALQIRHTSVGDAGMEHLSTMRGLESVVLHGTEVTPEGAQALAQALPHCEIWGRGISERRAATDSDTNWQVWVERGGYILYPPARSGKRFPCPCCGFFTLDEPEVYEICRVCGWEDSDLQCDDPAYQGGPNRVSLREARETFLGSGVAKARSPLYRCRPPLPDETPPDLQPLAVWLRSLDRTHPFPPEIGRMECTVMSLEGFIKCYKGSDALRHGFYGRVRFRCPRREVDITLLLEMLDAPRLTLLVAVQTPDTLHEWYRALVGLPIATQIAGGGFLRLGEEDNEAAEVILRTLTAVGHCSFNSPLDAAIEWESWAGP